MSLSRKLIMRCLKPLSSSIKNIAIGQDRPRTVYEDPGDRWSTPRPGRFTSGTGTRYPLYSTEGRQYDSLYSVSVTSSHVDYSICLSMCCGWSGTPDANTERVKKTP
jgi:hypothetical protein